MHVRPLGTRRNLADMVSCNSWINSQAVLSRLTSGYLVSPHLRNCLSVSVTEEITWITDLSTYFTDGVILFWAKWTFSFTIRLSLRAGLGLYSSPPPHPPPSSSRPSPSPPSSLISLCFSQACFKEHLHLTSSCESLFVKGFLFHPRTIISTWHWSFRNINHHYHHHILLKDKNCPYRIVHHT